MSTFTVIMLAFVAYFIIGGFIMGLIDNSQYVMSYVWFWPLHIMVWLIDLGTDAGKSVRGLIDKWKRG